MLGYHQDKAHRGIKPLFLCAAFAVFPKAVTAQDMPAGNLQIGDAAAHEHFHSQILFRNHEYRKAIVALRREPQDLSGRWLLAESLFRLEEYSKASRVYGEILAMAKDRNDRKKAVARLFSLEIYRKNFAAAHDHYRAFTEEFGTAPASMSYALGKGLYDRKKFDEALDVLTKIETGNEFYMRARYIVLVINKNKNSQNETALAFRDLSNSQVISTEDYWVRDYATLAEARIFADAGLFDSAKAAYLRIPISSGFCETATAELIRLALFLRNQAEFSRGRFTNLSKKIRDRFAVAALDSALSAMERFRKSQQVSSKTPELLSLMAKLMVETTRFDEARIAYDELIGHYRNVLKKLESSDSELDPYFSLDPQERSKTMLMKDLPFSITRKISEIKDLTVDRDRIEAISLRVNELRDDINEFGLGGQQLVNLESMQKALEQDYREVALKRQSAIAHKIKREVDAFLAEAEFERAELVIAHMRNLERRQKAVSDFQRENMDILDNRLKKLDEGESR